MTIDEFLIRDTDDLILPSKTFYPLDIPIAHPQLRHFINAPEPDLIYYASGTDIFCLNTGTKARTHICRVPFDCRCTAAGYGFVCVAGGDKGSFTVVELDDRRHPETDEPNSADVDTYLPLGLDDRPLGRPSAQCKDPVVRHENLGSDIINSITIHKLRADHADAREEVVAIITSNDKSIRIYSLTLGRKVASLEMPFPMNHATISPDDSTLLAVGDFNQAYFFERLVAPRDSKWTITGSKAEHWEVMNIVQLHCPKELVSVGYFTTAWSPSGGLCAVGSECGYVSVFDTELIRTADWGEDAMIEIVESTRPESRAGPGAIRSMMFSPHPWDLLIWAEDRGRVVIADIRAGLRVRQVIKLDPEQSGVRTAQMHDFSLRPRHLDNSNAPDDQDEASTIQGQLRALTQQVENLRQYRMALDADVDLAATTMSTEYLELLSERRRLQRLAAAVEEDPNGLTAEERQILDALRTNDGHGSTRDFAHPSSDSEHPRSLVYTREPRGPYGSSGLREFLMSSSSGLRSNDFVTTQDAEQRSTALQNGHTDLHTEDRNQAPSLSILRDFLRTRDSEPPRAYQPRRQASVVLPNDNASRSSSHTNSVPSYAQTVNNHGSLADARHAIETQWVRSQNSTSNSSTASGSTDRPYTPPPHVASPSNYTHLLENSRPSTSDSTSTPLPVSDDRAETSSPLRRRTPALRAIEAHAQTIAQLRQQGSTTNLPATSNAAPIPTHAAPGPFFASGVALRPTTSSSTSTSSASPPGTASGTASGTAPTVHRSAASLRDRSHSRVSDRLSDYEARVRYMSRYSEAQTLSFMHRHGARYESPDWGERSAGLAMSSGGDKLWCASERGILEIDVDVWGRRMWAAEKFA